MEYPCRRSSQNRLMAPCHLPVDFKAACAVGPTKCAQNPFVLPISNGSCDVMLPPSTTALSRALTLSSMTRMIDWDDIVCEAAARSSKVGRLVAASGKTKLDCSTCSEDYTDTESGKKTGYKAGEARQWYTSFGIQLTSMIDIHMSYRTVTSKKIEQVYSGTKENYSGTVKRIWFSI